MRYTVAILCLMLVPVLLESCEINGPVPHFEIKDLTLKTHGRRNYDDWSDTISSATPDSYKLSMFVEPKSRAMLNHRMTMGAYADVGTKESFQTCAAFKITTDLTLTTTNGDFAPGDLVTQYFEQLPYIINSRLIEWGEYNYYLVFSVTKKQKCSFKITITFDDGKVYELHSRVIELLPYTNP